MIKDHSLKLRLKITNEENVEKGISLYDLVQGQQTFSRQGLWQIFPALYSILSLLQLLIFSE